MSNTNKNRLYKIAIHLVGLMLLGLGIAVFVTANLGSDPITVLADGLHQVLNITVGTAMILLNVIVLVVVFFTKRSYIRIGTWISAVMTGVFVDIFIFLIGGSIFQGLSVLIRTLILVLGCVIIGAGIALYMSADIGVCLGDLIADILTKEKGWQYRWIKIPIDLFCLITGFLLGGKVGLGTIIGALLTGPLVQLFMPAAKRICSFKGN